MSLWWFREGLAKRVLEIGFWALAFDGFHGVQVEATPDFSHLRAKGRVAPFDSHEPLQALFQGPLARQVFGKQIESLTYKCATSVALWLTPRPKTWEVPSQVLGSLFQEFDIWGKIRNGRLTSETIVAALLAPNLRLCPSTARPGSPSVPMMELYSTRERSLLRGYAGVEACFRIGTHFVPRGSA